MDWSVLKEAGGKKEVVDRSGKSVSPPPPYTLLLLDPALEMPEGTEEKMTQAKITIGRGGDCEICFGDDFPMVSRRHASIEWANNNFYLRHLSATNQTLLNGRPISRKWFLQDGDVIQLASSGPKVRFNSASTPIDETDENEEEKKVDIYKVALVVVVAVSIALILWVSYLMIFE